MATYRKISVEVEAFQYDGDFKNSKGEYYVPDWAVEAYENGTLFFEDTGTNPVELFAYTSDGIWSIDVNDFIVRDINGDICAFSPEDFEKMYELVK